MIMLSTTGVLRIVSENGIANVDNKHVLTLSKKVL